MKHIVLTGGSGLLGFEVLQLLASSNEYHITSLHSNLPNELNDQHITYLKADLCDDSTYELLPTQVDAVIHLAQSNHFRKFPELGNDIFDVNVKSTQRLLDYAVKAKARTFIYTSTGGVYQAGSSNCKEDDILDFNPNARFYPTSKYMGELLVKSYHSLMHTIIFRPFFMYGKRQKQDMLIPRLIGNVIAGNEIQLDGENGLRINPIHVSDAAIALIKSLQLEGSHTINLAGNEIMSLRNIGEKIGEVFQSQPKFNSNLSKKANDLIADITTLESKLHHPLVDFKTGLAEFLHHEK